MASIRMILNAILTAHRVPPEGGRAAAIAAVDAPTHLERRRPARSRLARAHVPAHQGRREYVSCPNHDS